MGEVGGEEELVLADDGGGVGEHLLVGLGVEVPVALLHVLGGGPAEHGGLVGAAYLPLLVHALEPVRHPAASGLHPADAQIGEAFRYAGEHHADHVAEEADRKTEGVDLDEALVVVGGEVVDALGGGVDGEHDAEALRLLVEREVLRASERRVRADGREHRAGVPALGDGAAQLLDGLVDVLQWEERDALEARADGRELLVEEVVVGAADSDRDVRLPDERGGEADRGGVEDGGLHAALVHGVEPGLRVLRDGAEPPAEVDVPVVMARAYLAAPRAVGLVHVGTYLVLGLGDVSVAVDDAEWGLHGGILPHAACGCMAE